MIKRNINLLILPMEYSNAFSMIGNKLADRLGASSLLYAAVAYYSFDDEFAAQAMLDSNPDISEEILWWLEDCISSFYNLFDYIRAVADGKELDQVVFDDDEDTLYITNKTYL